MCTRPNAQIFRRNTIRILTWNVQGMKAGANQIAAALMRHNPDVITLQEYRTGQTSDQLASLLSEAGFGHPDHCTTCTGICSAVYGRDDIHSGVRPTGLGLAERYWVEATLNGIGISAVHIPPVGDRAGLRAPVWTAVLEHCGRVSNSHHILIGDLNTTRHLFDETGRSISGDHYLAGLEQAGWAEALRKCKPGKQEGSWFSSAGNGFRVDQAWLSPSLVPILTHAQLDHTVRELGYSDHSMLVVDLDI